MATSDLPLTLQTVYADLLDRAGSAAFDQAFAGDGSFTSKTIKGRVYWYFQDAAPEGRRQRYVGPETPELLERIKQHRAVRDDERDRRALVSTLVRSGSLPRPLPELGSVIEALAHAGVFRLRGVLVGTMAYQTYSAALGYRLPRAAIQTGDVDVAQFPAVSVAVDDTVEENMLDILRQADPSFRAIPDAHDGRRTHSYEAARGVRVEFLAPNRGPDSDEPAALPALATDAQLLRFLDFLIYETEPAVVLHGAGVYVRVPTAERYAVHKLIVARRRRESSIKIDKDLRQAEVLLDVLREKRGRQLTDVFDQAFRRGPKWQQLLGEGFGELSSGVRDRVLRHLGRARALVPGLELTFNAPALRYDQDRELVTMVGHAGNEPIRCSISREALEDHFGANGMSAEQRLARAREHRTEFERMCSEKYKNWRIEEGDAVLIRTEDVPALRAGAVTPKS